MWMAAAVVSMSSPCNQGAASSHDGASRLPHLKQLTHLKPAQHHIEKLMASNLMRQHSMESPMAGMMFWMICSSHAALATSKHHGFKSTQPISRFSGNLPIRRFTIPPHKNALVFDHESIMMVWGAKGLGH